MCGICGFLYTRETERPVSGELLHRMCEVMRHRGPDDEGIYTDRGFGMGMRRLSIIDLSSGRQPIYNESGRLAIICNGEIYNFPELREELIAKGHRFTTRSDTEVALHLFEEEGVEMVQRLNGMYAIAIWDADRRSLFLVRDRIGIKPLYYWAGPDRLLFASEIKCLLEDPELPREIDPTALHNYLSLNYIPAPETIYRSVRKLPQGHYLTWQAGRMEIRQYWNLRYGGIDGSDGKPRPEAWYAERLLELLKAAVKRHLISDVPLGVMSSGGIDSSTVVAIISRWFNRQVKTFSIGFEESSYNELEYARIIARQFGTDHREEIVRPAAAEILPRLAWHLDEPFADDSAIPTYYVSELARREVTVALSGDGGDELFAGYNTYGAHRFASLLKRIPGFLVRGLLQPAVNLLPVSDDKGSFDSRVRRLMAGYSLSPAEAHLCWKLFLSEEEKRRLYAPEYLAAISPPPTESVYARYYDSAPATHELDKLLYIDAKVYMVDDILMKVDKMSMAVSLEDRVPLLDYTVVEFAAALPPRMKLRGLVKKYILKQAMKGILPETILHRKKQGFSLPTTHWIKGELREMVQDLLSPSSLARVGLFSPGYIQTILGENFNGKRDHSRSIWGLTNFMLWYEAFQNQSAHGRR